MPVVTRHAPGTFCWFEIGTTDIGAGRAFYTSLLGWSMREDPSGIAPYTRFRLDGQDVGAGYRLLPQQVEAGVRPQWLQYVSVEDAAAVAAAATEHGGRVLVGPMEVADIGDMAVLSDPEGATFAIWQPRSQIGVTLTGASNTRCWSELVTRDAARARRFYTSVLPWTAASGSLGTQPYTRFRTVDGDAGGMLERGPGRDDRPARWRLYFAVDDCDATTRRAVALRGRVRVAPFESGDVGRCAVLEDPQGATFAVIRPRSTL